MNRIGIVFGALLVPGAALASLGYIDEAAPLSETSGHTKSRWVAPFVEHTESGGPSWPDNERVRWYSTKGVLIGESNELRSRQSPFGFLFESETEGSAVLHGMYNDWHLLKTDSAPRVASENGHTLVQFIREQKATAGMKVFVDGQLKASLGPIMGMKFASHTVSLDGSVAALFSPTSGNGPARCIVVDPRGETTLDFEESNVGRIHPSSKGRGALLWLNDGNLRYVGREGVSRLIPVDPALQLSSWCVIWVPESSKALIGSEGRGMHVLMDCDSGTILWDSEALGPLRLVDSRWTRPFGPYVFQSGLVPSSHTPGQQAREIKALDLETGQLVARWRSSSSSAYESWQDAGEFMIRDDRLYYMTGNEFSEIRPEEVARGGKGCCPWEPARAIEDAEK